MFLPAHLHYTLMAKQSSIDTSEQASHKVYQQQYSGRDPKKEPYLIIEQNDAKAWFLKMLPVQQSTCVLHFRYQEGSERIFGNRYLGLLQIFLACIS